MYLNVSYHVGKARLTCLKCLKLTSCFVMSFFVTWSGQKDTVGVLSTKTIVTAIADSKDGPADTYLVTIKE